MKREIHYAIGHRDGEVFLVRRPPDARLMAGMWELPELPCTAKRARKSDRFPLQKEQSRHGARVETSRLLFTLKHSITVTNYTVSVWEAPAPSGVCGEWVAAEKLSRVALTGLARKILRKAEILTPGFSAISILRNLKSCTRP